MRKQTLILARNDICNMRYDRYDRTWIFTSFSSADGEDWWVLRGGEQGVAVIDAILAWQPRLSLKIVTSPLPVLEMVVTVFLFESVTALETTFSRCA